MEMEFFSSLGEQSQGSRMGQSRLRGYGVRRYVKIYERRARGKGKRAEYQRNGQGNTSPENWGACSGRKQSLVLGEEDIYDQL